MTNQTPDYSTKGNIFLYGSQLSDALFTNTTDTYMKKGETSMQENFGVITVDSLVDNKDLRDKMIDRIEVLDKVKKLFMIPGLQMVSMRQVADYFDVEHPALYRCFTRNKDELIHDGVIQKTAKEIRSEQDVLIGKTLGNGGVEIDMGNGDSTILNNTKSFYFSLRAVLRFAMFLRDSAVAKEIRTQLLNVYDDASVVQRTRHVTEEWNIMKDAIYGMEHNDMERTLQSMTKMVQYANRHKQAAEELMVKNAALTESNASLETANCTLSGDALTSKPRALVCRLIRAYATMHLLGDHARAWTEFYHCLMYQASINVKTRKGFKNSWMDTIRDGEWEACVKIAASLCNRAGLDVGRIVKETNSQAYGGLLAFNSNETLCVVVA